MGPAHRSRFRSRAAVIVTLAALPILWTPNVVVARKVVGGFRVAIPGALVFAADGWIATGYVFVWQIALTRCRATRPRGSPGLAQTLAPLAGKRSRKNASHYGDRGFESVSLQRSSGESAANFRVTANCTLANTHTQTRLGQPDGISPSRMAEMLEVDKAEPKVRC